MGGLVALDGITFDVPFCSIVGLAGPNGAGKTVALNVITGRIPADGGRVIYKGMDITGLRPYEIARVGIGRTYQDVKIFPKLTVMENLLFAAQNKDVKDTMKSIFSRKDFDESQVKKRKSS